MDALGHGLDLAAAHIGQAALVSAEILDRQQLRIDQQEATHTAAGQLQGCQAAHRAAATDDRPGLSHPGGLEEPRIPGEQVLLQAVGSSLTASSVQLKNELIAVALHQEDAIAAGAFLGLGWLGPLQPADQRDPRLVTALMFISDNHDGLGFGMAIAIEGAAVRELCQLVGIGNGEGGINQQMTP